MLCWFFRLGLVMVDLRRSIEAAVKVNLYSFLRAYVCLPLGAVVEMKSTVVHMYE
jgi:hypothetical protein